MSRPKHSDKPDSEAHNSGNEFSDVNAQSHIISEIMSVCFEVYMALGKEALNIEYKQAVERKLSDKNIKCEKAGKTDMVLDNKIVIRINALQGITEQEVNQMKTDLEVFNYNLAFLLNFGTQTFMQRRVEAIKKMNES